MKLKPLKYMMVLGVASWALGAAGVSAQTAAPQPSTERTGSPYDNNPACRDRDVAGADPACVIQDGPPRQFNFDFNSTKPRPAAPPPAQENTAPPVIPVVPPQAK